MPSVLHVSQTTTEGVGQFLVHAVTDQRARGWPVTVASPPDDRLAAHVAAVGGAHEVWPAAREAGPSLARELRALRRIVRRVDPEVVHLHSSKAGLAGRLVVRGRRATVFTPHAWSFLHGGRLTRAMAVRWERVGARWATILLCVSDAERDRGEAVGIRGTWRVVRPGIDLRVFHPADAVERETARAELGVPADARSAVCVGRLAPQKGQVALVAAWPRVRAEVGDAELYLVGDGPDRAELESRAAPGVHLVGRALPTRPWYAAADVVVLPSRWEGFSFVVLEALACGRSVVACDVEGMRDAIGAGADAAGALVPPGDDEALAAAVAARLTDRALAGDEGRRGAARAEVYGLGRWGDAVAAVSEEALELGPPPERREI